MKCSKILIFFKETDYLRKKIRIFLIEKNCHILVTAMVKEEKKLNVIEFFVIRLLVRFYFF